MDKLIYISLFAFFTFACSTTQQIRSEWIVVDKQIQISNDWEYLIEIDSMLLTNKFNRSFPNQMNIGDQITISRDQVVNKDKTYSYYCSDSTLNIRHTDVIYSLKYRLLKNEMEIYRELQQGNIMWTLKKNER